MTSRLLLLANSFPFGNQEPYLLLETEFYERFDEVHIFSLSVKSHQRDSLRELQRDDIRVFPIHFKKPLFYALNSVVLLADRDTWTEITRVVRRESMSVAKLVQILSQFSRARYEARQISKYIDLNIQEKAGDQTVLYAYRFLYQPVVLKRLAVKFRSPKLIGRAHGIDLFEERSSTNYLPGRELNLDALDALYSVSKNGAEYLARKFPRFRDKIKVSYLGTRDHGVRPTKAADGVLRLVSCSHVVGVKRLDLLVDALRMLGDETLVEWVHYGTGDDFEALAESVRDLPDHISVDLKGWVANDEVVRNYAAGFHDVFVNVSSSEGLPVSIMEACSAGLPVLATDVGGTNEIVEDGLNGVLLPADVSSTILADAITRVASADVDEYQKFSRAARKKWTESFDSARNYRKFVTETLGSFE